MDLIATRAEGGLVLLEFWAFAHMHTTTSRINAMRISLVSISKDIKRNKRQKLYKHNVAICNVQYVCFYAIFYKNIMVNVHPE